VRRKFKQVLIPQFIVVYCSEKNYENRSIFARVITKINVSRFLWPTVYEHARLCDFVWRSKMWLYWTLWTRHWKHSSTSRQKCLLLCYVKK